MVLNDPMTLFKEDKGSPLQFSDQYLSLVLSGHYHIAVHGDLLMCTVDLFHITVTTFL